MERIPLFQCVGEGVNESFRQLYEEGIKSSMSLTEFLNLAESLINKYKSKKIQCQTLQSEDYISYVAEAMMREACKTDDKNRIMLIGIFAVKSWTRREQRHFRQQERHNILAALEGKSVEPDFIEELIKKEEHKEQLRLIHQRKLTKRQKQIINMRLNNLSFKQIAKQLNTSIANIHMCYKRAIETLRELINYE
jgi:RNA polymerase sigma factor (sigma-70 family)